MNLELTGGQLAQHELRYPQNDHHLGAPEGRLRDPAAALDATADSFITGCQPRGELSSDPKSVSKSHERIERGKS